MKVKTIVRSAEEATRERSGDLRKVHRNLDPALRPLERATEAKRALNAVKLDRVFAKPFVAAFGHDDGVTALARSPARLNALVSGCADGTLSVWDLAGRRKLRRLVGHAAAIQGVSVSASGDALVSCSADGAIRMFRLPFAPPEPGSVVSTSEFSSAVRGGGDAASSSVVDAAAVAEFDGGGGGLSSVDHHPRSRGVFATGGGAGVAVWDAARSRSAPVQRLEWGADGVRAVRFNPAEPSLLVAAGGADRAVVLFDVRASTPVRKLVMQTRATAAAWNPIEPFNLVAASEDTNLYSFDARMFSKGATCVHQDFVSAVTSVDWSPTGREFVAGGYDRSVRIFGARAVSRFFFFLFGFLVFEVRKRRERKKRKNSSFFFWSRLSLTRALFFSPLSLSFPLSLFSIPPPPPSPKTKQKTSSGPLPGGLHAQAHAARRRRLLLGRRRLRRLRLRRRQRQALEGAGLREDGRSLVSRAARVGLQQRAGRAIQAPSRGAQDREAPEAARGHRQGGQGEAGADRLGGEEEQEQGEALCSRDGGGQARAEEEDRGGGGVVVAVWVVGLRRVREKRESGEMKMKMQKKNERNLEKKVTFSLALSLVNISLSLSLPSLSTMGRGLSQRRRVANVLKARQVKDIISAKKQRERAFTRPPNKERKRMLNSPSPPSRLSLLLLPQKNRNVPAFPTCSRRRQRRRLTSSRARSGTCWRSR